jgi:hypothetical protein
MSTVRYLADYTFHFRPSKVRHLLRDAGIAVSESPGRPIIVVPIYQDGDKLILWDDPNPWREAWGQAPATSGTTRFTVPLGGIGDLSTIDAEQARAGDAQALTEIAEQNGGDKVLVVLARTRKNGDELIGLDITAQQYHLGLPIEKRSDSIDANPGEPPADFLKRAVGVVVSHLAKGAPANAKEATLAAVVPIAALSDWVAIQQRLAAVPGIRRVNLLSLSRQEAKIEIRYIGNPDQLKSSLAQADLNLAGAEPDWRLVPASAAGAN